MGLNDRMPKLIEDVYSIFYNKKTGKQRELIKLGCKGEEVKIIGDHDNVMIVENLTGERYSVKTRKLKF